MRSDICLFQTILLFFPLLTTALNLHRLKTITRYSEERPEYFMGPSDLRALLHPIPC